MTLKRFMYTWICFQFWFCHWIIKAAECWTTCLMLTIVSKGSFSQYVFWYELCIWSCDSARNSRRKFHAKYFRVIFAGTPVQNWIHYCVCIYLHNLRTPNFRLYFGKVKYHTLRVSWNTGTGFNWCPWSHNFTYTEYMKSREILWAHGTQNLESVASIHISLLTHALYMLLV